MFVVPPQDEAYHEITIDAVVLSQPIAATLEGKPQRISEPSREGTILVEKISTAVSSITSPRNSSAKTRVRFFFLSSHKSVLLVTIV